MTDDVIGETPAVPDLPAVRDILSAPSRRPPGIHSTYLSPTDPFPDLAVLSLHDLQVLHSRVARQQELEYLQLEGPHPVTLDRLDELTRALDSQDHQP
ncbi:hypothetical protein GCM10011512_05840 [Tersicoccus solisilvae]|uniref:Uncharacterized protein n=1 Tax=Tersicoccus solisilvae TaxID=1882339 RepID=A0ABQ1NS03_9MICC|nr:hypothetical protein [Tersicoccus solisilvae]GGC81914.1 hypothetical protein GCM10011512_05840 [Tersicoccus solisilvae]